jgi:hypothetical protein
VLCIILVDLCNRDRALSTGHTAHALQDLDGSGFEIVQVENTMKEMLDAGSRYNNLEKALGEGVVFVLGMDVDFRITVSWPDENSLLKVELMSTLVGQSCRRRAGRLSMRQSAI